HRAEDDELVTAEAQGLDAVEDLLLVVEQVADEADDALALDLTGDLVKHGPDARYLRRLKPRERPHDVVQAGEVARARDVIPHGRVEQADGGGVTLVKDQVREARSHRLAVVEL